MANPNDYYGRRGQGGQGFGGNQGMQGMGADTGMGYQGYGQGNQGNGHPGDGYQGFGPGYQGYWPGGQDNFPGGQGNGTGYPGYWPGYQGHQGGGPGSLGYWPGYQGGGQGQGSPQGQRYYYNQHQQGAYYGHGRPDDELKQEIRQRLNWDNYVDAAKIQVEVKNGEVTLSGDVGSLMEKRAAGDDACDVPGVKDIHNQLNIHQHGSAAQGQAQQEKQATK